MIFYYMYIFNVFKTSSIRYISIFILGFLIYSGFSGCSKTEHVKPGSTYIELPMIVTERTKYSKQFVIKNTFNKTIRVLDKKHSCSCTKSTLTKSVIEPNEEVTLTLEMELPTTKTQKKVTCTLVTDCQEFIEWPYNLEIMTYPVCEIDSPQIDMGNLSSDQEKKLSTFNYTRYSTIENQIEKEICELQQDDENKNRGIILNVKNPSIKKIGEGIFAKTWPIEVYIEKEKKSYSNRQNFHTIVVSTNKGHKSSVLLFWRVTINMEIIPSNPHFGIVKMGDERRIDIVIKSSKRPFTIKSIDVSPQIKILPVNWKISSNSHTITAVYQPTRYDDNESLVVEKNRFLVITDDPENSQIKIPWTAFVKSPK